MRLKIAGLLLLFKIPADAQAQSGPQQFSEEINFFKQQDSIAVPADPILFIGSSSIKNWIAFDSTFGIYGAINRGFGGSTLLDQLYYAKDVALAYNPRQIVIYCGENDFASTPTLTAAALFDRYVQLYSQIRNRFPEVPVVCISMKPSPAKLYMMQKIMDYNALLKEYASIDSNLLYADIFTPMLLPTGKPDVSCFFADQTHMNRKGYAIWNAVIDPLLIKPEPVVQAPVNK